MRASIILIVMLMGTPALAQDNAARAIAECDRLAASDMDTQRPPTAPGVPISSIIMSPSTALTACLAAAKAAPADGRIIFQLGRALHAGGQYEDARSAYQLAAQLGHV